MAVAAAPDRAGGLQPHRRPPPGPRGSVDPLHLPQDPAFVHGEHGLVVPDLLEHRSTGKLVACFFEVIPSKENPKIILVKLHCPLSRECMSTRGLWQPQHSAMAGLHGPSDRDDPTAAGAGPPAQTGGLGAQDEAGPPASSSL